MSAKTAKTQSSQSLNSMNPPSQISENAIAKIIVDSAFQIHRSVGPGLLESVYEAILARDLSNRGLAVVRQRAIAIRYEGLEFDEGFRADLVVNDAVIVEVKSVERAVPQHKRQLLTYLRFAGLRLGILINFWEPYFKDAVIRVVNGLPGDDKPMCNEQIGTQK